MKTLRDAVYGLAVADALGVPVEFSDRGTFHVTDMTGYGTYYQPPGTWSDDTSMTLATCFSIKRKKGVDPSDIMECFRAWKTEGKFTADGVMFDIGWTTSQAISQGFGLTDISSNGNGSLMRIIPLAFVPGITDEEVREVSALTHGHEISKEACVIYINIAKRLLAGMDVMEAVRASVNDSAGEVFARLPGIHELPEEEIKSSGYVVDTLEAAVWALATTKSYEECALRAVNLGKDTDTVGAVAGALAGILYGYEGIPDKWIKILRNKELIEECLFS